MSHSSNVLHQPKPFYLIFFIEMWERFGFYGLQAILAIYLVSEQGMTESDSFVLFGAFSALVFGLMSIGGYLGDKVLGTKRTLLLGAVVMMVGYIMMTMAGGNKSLMFLALSSVAVGNGLFKANPSSLLAKCYEKGDSRLSGAFIMYYMSINIGSFISIAAVPTIAEWYGWNIGFLCSAVGLFAALGNYYLTRHWVADYGSEPDFHPLSFKVVAGTAIGLVLSCIAGAWILNNLTIANILLSVMGVCVLLMLGKEIIAARGVERYRMLVAVILMFEAVVFWVVYLQMPTSLNFFAIHNVEHQLLGLDINPVSYQSLNPFWVMIASPVMAYISNRQGRAGMTMPNKFALGMMYTGLSFLVLPLGAQLASEQGIVSSYWLVICYLFQAVGELLISALGLAMVAELMPERLHGFIMGVWFLTVSAGSLIGGYVAGFTSLETFEGATALDSLAVYNNFFTVMGGVVVIFSVLMFLTAPWLKRMSTAGGGETTR